MRYALVPKVRPTGHKGPGEDDEAWGKSGVVVWKESRSPGASGQPKWCTNGHFQLGNGLFRGLAAPMAPEPHRDGFEGFREGTKPWGYSCARKGPESVISY